MVKLVKYCFVSEHIRGITEHLVIVKPRQMIQRCADVAIYCFFYFWPTHYALLPSVNVVVIEPSALKVVFSTFDATPL